MRSQRDAAVGALPWHELPRGRAAARGELGVDVQDGGWALEEDEERVRWAYSEARKLLQRYSGVREALQERMSAGVSAGEWRRPDRGAAQELVVGRVGGL